MNDLHSRADEALTQARNVLGSPSPDGTSADATDGSVMNLTKVAEFADLDDAIDAMETVIKAMKARKAILEPLILEQFSQAGVPRVPVNGRLVHMHTQIWASAKDGDKAAACAALKACDLGEYVSEGFNTNSLSAWVREQVAADRELPQPVADALTVTEKVTLRVRKA